MTYDNGIQVDDNDKRAASPNEEVKKYLQAYEQVFTFDKDWDNFILAGGLFVGDFGAKTIEDTYRDARKVPKWLRSAKFDLIFSKLEHILGAVDVGRD